MSIRCSLAAAQGTASADGWFRGEAVVHGRAAGTTPVADDPLAVPIGS